MMNGMDLFTQGLYWGLVVGTALLAALALENYGE